MRMTETKGIFIGVFFFVLAAVGMFTVLSHFNVQAQSLYDGALNGQLYIYLQEDALLKREEISLYTQERELKQHKPTICVKTEVLCQKQIETELEQFVQYNEKMLELRKRQAGVRDKRRELRDKINTITGIMNNKRSLAPRTVPINPDKFRQ